MAMHPPRRSADGFSLIELLVAIGIVAIISAIAFPIYTDYIQTSEDGVLLQNVMTMELFQEDFRLRNGAYANDLADLAAITDAIGWEPQADDGFLYSIAASDGSIYQVTATNESGYSICVEFPSRDRC